MCNTAETKELWPKVQEARKIHGCSLKLDATEKRRPALAKTGLSKAKILVMSTAATTTVAATASVGSATTTAVRATSAATVGRTSSASVAARATTTAIATRTTAAIAGSGVTTRCRRIVTRSRIAAVANIRR